MSEKFSIPITLVLVSALLATSNYIKSFSIHPKPKVSEQDRALNYSSFFLKLASFGERKLLADLLWIKTLLDSDHEHYQGKGRDLQSWMYLRFKAISDLDERFKENYVFGGRYLAIIKDDVYGSNSLIEKGLEIYPRNEVLLKTIAFNYAFELRDYKKGKEYYQKVLEYGLANPLIKSLIAKLSFETGAEPKVVIGLLQNLYDETPENHRTLRGKIAEEINKVQVELDLECLNGDRKGCVIKNPYGFQYKQDAGGTYRAPKGFVPYKVFTRKNPTTSGT